MTTLAEQTPATRRRGTPRRTVYSRAEAPLGAVRERDAGNGQLVRMVKVRMDGPTGLRWIPYAKWWWERNRGPVPKGKRVCHADGVLLNDAPENLVLLTPGEVFRLYHRLDPAMSRRNRAACGRSAARRNREAARRRRLTTWLPSQWYAVDLWRRAIVNRPRRKRWMVYADHGFAERLAERLRERAAAARAGDTAAAAYVLRQTATLGSYWRWLRSASLGWPGVNCMTACILHVLAAAGRPLWTCDVLDEVRALRRLVGWRPYALQVGVLSTCASAVRPWIRTRHEGPRMTLWWVTPEGLAARLPGPRIVPVRGRDLAGPAFAEFQRIEPEEADA
jgi:hypothetical protein